MFAAVVVLVPIYKAELGPDEQFALEHSLPLLKGRDVRFIAPQALAADFYIARYPGIAIDRFSPPSFESIPEYNRLLLNPDFYVRYSAFEYMLILQTDAILLRDELDDWCNKPYDYIGAPWPKAFELVVQTGRFQGASAKHAQVHVGNGGLSLRRNRSCIQLLQEFPVERALFIRAGSSEDLFFSVMGSLSTEFVMPNEMVASKFSMEGRPSLYYQMNGGCLPMGAHAWTVNEKEFWLNAIRQNSI